MSTNPEEIYNCQEFIELHRDYSEGKIDKSLVDYALPLIFKKRGLKIRDWLKRPLNPEAKNIHTVAKFDL